MEVKKLNILFDYVFILAGCFSIASGIVFFLSPALIPAGGPPGLAIIAQFSFSISPALVLLAINLPLLALGYKFLGRVAFIRSIIALCLLSAATALLPEVFSVPDLSGDRLLSAMYGGLIMGLGLGLILKSGAAPGGWSILGRFISQHVSMSLGQCLFLMDAGVILLSAVVFRDLEAAMLGGIAVFVTGRTVDMIVSTSSDIKVVHISCWKAERLKPIIEKNLGITGSVVQAKSMKSGGDKEILFLIIEKSQLIPVRKLVEEFDPQAYLVVLNALEVYGAGSRVQ